MPGRLAVFLSVTLVVGCGDDGGPLADSGPPSEGGVDLATDTGVPFTLPKGGAGHPDVGAKLVAGQARAGRVTDASQLLTGIKVEGRVGDYKLYNDKVAFIIREATWSDGYAPFGGELLDAARVDRSGPAGQSALGETFLSAGVRMLDPTSVGVVADGSDGKAAVVRAIGEPAQIPILASLLGNLGASFEIHLVIDYVLEPNSSALELRWRVFNKLTTEQEITLVGIGFTSGDGVELFAEKSGFDVAKASRTDWIGMIGQDLAYVWYSADQPVVPIITYEGLWILENGSIKVPAAGEATRTYYLGLTDGEPEAAWRMVRSLKKQSEPTQVSGKVLDAQGAAVPGARVHVQKDDAAGTYVTMTRAGSDGAYGLALAPGDYLLTAAAEGRELGAPVKLTVASAPASQDLTMGGTATIGYAVTDGAGAKLPAKLVFKRAAPLPGAPASFGEFTFPGGAALMVFAPDGSGTATVPPGAYSVTASRGFEYEIDSASVTVADGESGSASLKLVRSVDTTGFMCGDFHTHAMWSPDSSDLYELKVAAYAGEGLELPVITDHEYISDIDPFITKLGLQKWIQGVTGEELTTFVYGHFNPFPIVPDPKKPNRGAMVWVDKKPAELFADVRKAWPDAVLQINHPRRGKPISAYFQFAGYDPTTGTAQKSEWWSRNFDAIEAFNGSGWTTNKNEAVLDWYSFLDRGEPKTVTGNSDSHHAYSSEVGYPRNYVKLSTDEPGKVSMAVLAKAVKDQQVLVSGGPFVTVDVGGKGMGEVAAAPGGKATLAVRVQAPTWMPADELQVVLGGATVKTVTLDASTADPNNPVVRYDGSLELTPSKDTWVVVVVTGQGTLAPVSSNDEPFALTNPIYLDVDGNGVYDPPKAF